MNRKPFYLAIFCIFVAFFSFFFFFSVSEAYTGDCANSQLIFENSGSNLITTSITGNSAGTTNYSNSFSTSTDFTICSVQFYCYRATYDGTFLFDIASAQHTSSSRTIYSSSTASNTICPRSVANINWGSAISIPPLDIPANVTRWVNISYFSGNNGTQYPIFGYQVLNNNTYSQWYTNLKLQSYSTKFRIYGVPFSPTSSTSPVYGIIPTMQPILGQTCVTDGATTTCSIIESATTTAIEVTSGDLLLFLAFILAFISMLFAGFVIKTFLYDKS